MRGQGSGQVCLRGSGVGSGKWVLELLDPGGAPRGRASSQPAGGTRTRTLSDATRPHTPPVRTRDSSRRTPPSLRPAHAQTPERARGGAPSPVLLCGVPVVTAALREAPLLPYVRPERPGASRVSPFLRCRLQQLGGDGSCRRAKGGFREAHLLPGRDRRAGRCLPVRPVGVKEGGVAMAATTVRRESSLRGASGMVGAPGPGGRRERRGLERWPGAGTLEGVPGPNTHSP